MHASHDMSQVSKDGKTVTVYYNGCEDWVRVRGGKVVKHTHGGQYHLGHALAEADRVLGLVASGEVD